MLRSIRHWMNQASRKSYCGPKEAAVETLDDALVMLDLTDWSACHAALNSIPFDEVVGVYTKAPKGGWAGEANVCDLMGTHSVYTQGHATVEEARKELNDLVAAAEMRYAEQTATPEAELAALRALDARDPYKHMSDDHRVWSAGEVLSRRIHTLEAHVSMHHSGL